MKITFNPKADALYIYFRKRKVAKTIKAINRLLIDLDRRGNVLGIEMLDVSRQVPKKEIGRISTEMPVYT